MGAKITLVGKIKEIRHIKSPVNEKVELSCFEIETGGSATAPKGMPTASLIQYTVLVNDKQYKKLQSELDTLALTVEDATLVIQGEITIDQPMDVVEGDIGVIAFNVGCVETTKKEKVAQEVKVETIEKTAGPIPCMVSFEHIDIPEKFATPSRVKVDNVIAHYKEHGVLIEPVKIKKSGDRWLLVDGYTKFVAAQELGLNEIPAIIVPDNWVDPDDRSLIKKKPRKKVS